MQGLIFALIVLGLVLVIVWGLAQGERERVQRARDRQYMREVRRQ